MISIGGLVPFSTLDFPGKISAVVFTFGCPFRCPYCSNPELLESKETLIPWDEYLKFLPSRKKMLDAIVFSGGEALMQKNIANAMKITKKYGYKIGIHTNGYYPEKLKEALPYLDWAGLDFKAPLNEYDKISFAKNSAKKFEESLQILLDSGIDFEVRTTCDPRFLTKEKILEMAKYLSDKGVKNYGLQKYHAFGTNAEVLDDELTSQFFNDSEFKAKLEKLFNKVDFR